METTTNRSPFALIDDPSNNRMIAWMGNENAYVPAEDLSRGDVLPRQDGVNCGIVEGTDFVVTSKRGVEAGRESYYVHVKVYDKAEKFVLPPRKAIMLDVDYSEKFFEYRSMQDNIVVLRETEPRSWIEMDSIITIPDPDVVLWGADLTNLATAGRKLRGDLNEIHDVMLELPSRGLYDSIGYDYATGNFR